MERSSSDSKIETDQKTIKTTSKRLYQVNRKEETAQGIDKNIKQV